MPLFGNFTYKPAIRFKSKDAPTVSAKIDITTQDKENNKYDVTCYFNSQSKVKCYLDPYNLDSTKDNYAIMCFEKAVNWKYHKFNDGGELVK